MAPTIKNKILNHQCNRLNLFTSAIKTVAFGKDGVSSNSTKFIVK